VYWTSRTTTIERRNVKDVLVVYVYQSTLITSNLFKSMFRLSQINVQIKHVYLFFQLWMSKMIWHVLV